MPSPAQNPAQNPDDREAAFHARIGDENLGALWVGRRGVDLSRPGTPAKPAIWRFDELRPRLMEAGRLVSAEDAFRRVLVLQNPGFAGAMRATQTLYAGLQLVLPGEIAPCHRHSQTAIRFVVEGSGALTTVDGAAMAMAPNDMVVTPQWSWHDHRNPGGEPVIWLDILDTPLIDALDTVFRETHADTLQPLTRSETEMRPALNHRAGPARAALERMAGESAPDPCLGWRFRYDDPGPTMAAFLQRLPGGFAGPPRRATDGAVYCVVEGPKSRTGSSRGASMTFSCCPDGAGTATHRRPARFCSASATWRFRSGSGCGVKNGSTEGSQTRGAIADRRDRAVLFGPARSMACRERSEESHKNNL